MLRIITIDLVIKNELTGTFNFTNRALAEAFAESIKLNVKDELKDDVAFVATEYEVIEDFDELAFKVGKMLGIEEERINEIVEEVKKEN